MSSEYSEGLSSRNGQARTERRLRVLICACTSEDAAEIFRSFQLSETVVVPSSDLSEIAVEVAEMQPDFVLCKSGFLTQLISNQSMTRATSPGVAANGVDSQTSPDNLSSVEVNAREREVLELLAKGARTVDIGQALGLTGSSIKRILQHLYERFEVANRAELLGRVMELKLLVEDADRVGSRRSRGAR